MVPKGKGGEKGRYAGDSTVLIVYFNTRLTEREMGVERKKEKKREKRDGELSIFRHYTSGPTNFLRSTRPQKESPRYLPINSATTPPTSKKSWLAGEISEGGYLNRKKKKKERRRKVK